MERFKTFEFKVIATALIVCAAHLWQYFDSGFNVNCIVRCILIFIAAISGVIFKKNAIYISGYIISSIIMYFDAFNNYSVFFFAYIVMKQFPRYKLAVIISYVINILIVCEMHDRYPSHLVVHFGMCLIFYWLSEDSRTEVKILELTDDEERILYQLEIELKTLDNVEGYSKSTVIRRLNSACLKNGISIKEHDKLRDIYKKSVIETKVDTIAE